MRLLLIILFSLIGLSVYSQTYSRDGLGIKWIQLEGCRKVSNGQPGDSCFVMTNGINGKLSRCLHISELRALITGGVGPTDSTYLVDNGDGSYSLFNENGTEYPFGYKFEEVGDTIFLTDLDGHRADTLVMSLLDNQTLSWDPGTGDLGIANGNTVNLDGRYLLSEVDGDPTNELQFVDSFYTSNDSLFISLDRDSVAPSYVVLNPGADGNGIYGGSGEVPNNTYAHVPLTNDFAIGHFRSFPASVETSDRGLWLSGDEFYLYANDSLSGGLARIYTSNLDIINVSTLDSAESYFHVDPDRATVFSEDGINATNITARPDSLDMYSRLWTPEFDSARLRLETTYGNPGDVLTSDGMYMRWSAPSGGGNGIYGGSDMVPDQTYAQIGTEAPHSNIAQDSVFAIGYHPLFPNLSATNSRGLFWDSFASGFYIMGADTVNNVYTYTNYTGSQYTTSRNSSTGEISEVNIGPAYVNYDVYDATDTSMIDILLDSIDMLSKKVHVDTDTLRLKIGGTYGTNGYVLTSDGTNAEWAAATGGAQSNSIGLSGNVITSNVDGQIDTTLAVGNVTATYSSNVLTVSVNGVSDTAAISSSGGSTPSVITPSQITSDQDNYDPTGFGTATIVRISGDASIRAITSMAAQDDGEEKKIINVGSYPIYFPGEHPDGIDSNRILAGCDIFIWPGESMTFIYDDTSERWRPGKSSAIESPVNGIMYEHSLSSVTASENSILHQSGSGGTLTAVAASSSVDMGAMRLSTSTSASGYYSAGLSKAGNFANPTFSHITAAFDTRLFGDTSVAGQRYMAAWSLKNGIGNLIGSANQIQILYCDTINNGFVQIRSIDSTAAVFDTVNTQFNLEMNELYHFVIELNKGRTEARVYANGTFLGRITANMPQLDAGYSVSAAVKKTSGTTARGVDIHRFIGRAISP